VERLAGDDTAAASPQRSEADHHKIANKPNAPISMINAATVIAIGRIAL
jgi:hypothetical protein